MEPPSYEESQNQSGQGQDQSQGNYGRDAEQRPSDPPRFNEGKSQHQYQQGYSDYPEDKKHPQGPGYEGSGPGYNPGPGYNSGPGYGGGQAQNSNGPPPNTYFVPPQMVNITQANPQHLNPSYQQYLERDQQRIKEGNYPDPSRGLDKTRNKGGKSSGFPGRSGVSYNNAANK